MPWRQGTKVPINVYDSENRPVCQCQTTYDAAVIVKAVNAFYRAARAPAQTTAPDEMGISGNACADCGTRVVIRGRFSAGDPRLASHVLFQCPNCKTVEFV